MSGIREADLLTFKFRFVNSQGKRNGIVPILGRVSREGIVLGSSRIFFEDVYRTEKLNDLVVIILKPFCILNENAASHIIDGFTSLILDVNQFAFQLKSIIDRRLTSMALEEATQDMTKEEIEQKVKNKNCPNCDAVIDLTGVKLTRYIYCKYCDNTFDKFGYMLVGLKQYKICPESMYFDRVRFYHQYKIQFTGTDFNFDVRKIYCGDFFASSFIRKELKLNFTLLIGAILSGLEYLRVKKDRNTEYEDLPQALKLAEEGNMAEADTIFQIMCHRGHDNPGIWYNYALVHLRKGNYGRAKYLFKKSLEQCSNYEPTFLMIEKHREYHENAQDEAGATPNPIPPTSEME